MDFIQKGDYKISSITMGTAQLGLNYGVNNAKGMPSYEESSELLTTALNAGITSFDTARAYGVSEQVLGRYFTENPVEKTLITKVVFADEKKDEVRESMLFQVKDSIKKLGVERLPMVLLHNESYIAKYGNVVLDALQEVKDEGLVDYVGMSFSVKDKLEEYASLGVFDAIQIPANMFDSKEIQSGFLEELSSKDITVFVRSIYLQGLFFKDTNQLPEKIKSAKSRLDALHALAERNGMNMAQLAFGFMRDTKGIDSLVLGADTPEQLLESVSLTQMDELSNETLGEILEIAKGLDPVVTRPWEWFK